MVTSFLQHLASFLSAEEGRAIAYAFHAASSDNLEEIEFQQEKMREHLFGCFTKQKQFLFPHLQKRAHVPRYTHGFHTRKYKCSAPVKCQNALTT